MSEQFAETPTGGAVLGDDSVLRGADRAIDERLVRVREGFARLLGADAVESSPNGHLVMGPLSGVPVLFPRSEEEVAACLRLATERGLGIVPAGAGSWLQGANSVGRTDAVLSVSRLDQIVQYEPADLTLTTGAGLALDGVDRLVSQERQWLPLDPPGVEQGTLGGTLATGSVGGLGLAYGAPRDLALGLRLVTGDGRVLRLGGRVVKNVAGFDLVKLAVGSWGTLGVITEVTFRLFPRPQRELCLVCRAGTIEELIPAARRVARSRIAPAAVEVLERPTQEARGSAREALLVVRVLGLDERVSNEAATLASMIIEAAPGDTAVEQGDARSEDGAQLLRAIRHVDDDADLGLRLMGPVAQLADLVTVARAAGRLRPGRDELAGTAYRLSVDALRGSVTLAVPRVRIDPPWADMWAERILELRENVERRGGSLTLTSGPADVVNRAGTWGRPGRTARLLKGLKAQFDPGGVLSPGRLAFEED